MTTKVNEDNKNEIICRQKIIQMLRNEKSKKTHFFMKNLEKYFQAKTNFWSVEIIY